MKKSAPPVHAAVPGFEFLRQLTQGGAASWAQWVAPTLDAQALDKRIEELKAVQFWLDQNAAALKATIQALEVQKMTLATLQSMNVSLNRADDAQVAKPSAASAVSARRASAPATPSAAQRSRGQSVAQKQGRAAASLVDPLQLWGALGQQFQQIAAQALKDTAASAASDKRRRRAG